MVEPTKYPRVVFGLTDREFAGAFAGQDDGGASQDDDESPVGAGGRELKPPLRDGSLAKSEARSRPPPTNKPPEVQKPSQGRPRTALRFPPSVRPTRSFYRRFYPGTSTIEWNDWRWQMRARIRTLAELERIFRLFAGRTKSRRPSCRLLARRHHGLTTRALWGSKMHTSRCAATQHHDRRRVCPGSGRETMIPWARTTTRSSRASSIAIRIASCSLTTGTCSTYCRYCTRSPGFVGNPGGEYQFSNAPMGKGARLSRSPPPKFAMCCSRAATPLTLGDEKLDWLARAGLPRHQAHRIPANRHQDAPWSCRRRNHQEAGRGPQRSIIRSG